MVMAEPINNNQRLDHGRYAVSPKDACILAVLCAL